MAVAFWGAFFGAVTISFVAAVLAFTRSARRVAQMASLTAVLSAVYALVFLGWVPVDNRDTLLRVQAHVAIGSTAILALLLFMLLGSFRNRLAVMLGRLATLLVTGSVLVATWLLSPVHALKLAMLMEGFVAVAALVVAVGSARRGERSGMLSLAALPCVLVSVAGLAWHALYPGTASWQVHAASAIAGIAYLLCIATAMWSRYAYLIEVSQVMKHGPDFDPITRMPTGAETAALVRDVFAEAAEHPCGVIAVAISNLKVIEQLQGREAYNHALFACGSRLRRLALPGVDLARLGDDGFLLLVREPRDAQQLTDCAEQVLARLARPVVLGTSRDLNALEASEATWTADVGVGLLMATAETEPEPELALAGARAIARTAWSYPSRMGWFDHAAEEISEWPAPPKQASAQLQKMPLRWAKALAEKVGAA